MTIKYPSAVWAQAHMGSLSCICPAEVSLGLKKKMGRRCEKRQGERPEQSTQQIWAHSGAPRLSSLPPSGTPSLLNDFQKPKQEGMGLNSQIINKTQAGSGGLKLIPKLHVSAELPLSEEETRSDLIIN